MFGLPEPQQSERISKRLGFVSLWMVGRCPEVLMRIHVHVA